jgi:hypothetical protein
MKTENDVAARSSDNGAALGGDDQSSNLSSRIWSSMIAESQASQSSSNNASDSRPSTGASDSRSSNGASDSRPSNGGSDSRPAQEPRPADTAIDSGSPKLDGSGGRIGFSSKPQQEFANADRVPPNAASDATRRPAENLDPNRPNVGGDIRPNSMVDNQTLMDRFAQQSANLHMEQLQSPVVRMLSPEFHQQSQQMINNADNLPFDRIQQERASTERQQQGIHDDMSTSEQRMLEASQSDPELQQMIPRMLENIDNPRFHGMHGNDMNRLRQIAPELAEAMEQRRGLGRQSQELQDRIDNADTLMEKPTSTRFDYATNLIDSGLPENRDRAVQVLTELLNNNPLAARYTAPGSSGNRTMAEMILRSNALDSKAFAGAFARAGGNPNTLMQQWSEDRFSFRRR